MLVSVDQISESFSGVFLMAQVLLICWKSFQKLGLFGERSHPFDLEGNQLHQTDVFGKARLQIRPGRTKTSEAFAAKDDTDLDLFIPVWVYLKLMGPHTIHYYYTSMVFFTNNWEFEGLECHSNFETRR